MKQQGFEIKTTFSSDSEKEKYNNEYDELYNTCKKAYIQQAIVFILQ